MIAANTAGLSLLPVFVGPVSLERGVLAQKILTQNVPAAGRNERGLVL